MAKVSVERVQRRLKISDEKSPMMYFLRQTTKTSKTYDIQDLAKDIETIGALSAEDVLHVAHSLMRSIRKVLTSGNKVKIPGFGLFYTTFKCKGVKTEEECSVKNIGRVNLRFKVDSSLRLVNDSIATTRGADNNVVYELESLTKKENGGKPSSDGKTDTGGGNKPKPDDKPDPGDDDHIPDPLS